MFKGQSPFYFGIIRKLTIGFSTLLKNVKVARIDSNGNPFTVDVPLTFMPKEKFLMRLEHLARESEAVAVATILPQMGFEISAINYDSSRKTDSLKQFIDKDGNKFSFNRTPWNVSFDVTIASRRLDDLFQIIEQFAAYFTPEITLKILDHIPFDFETNVPIIMNTSDLSIDYQGTFNERRIISASIIFTAKAYFYPNVRDLALIKETTVNLGNFDDFDRDFWENINSQVIPREAGESDPHEIITTINEN